MNKTLLNCRQLAAEIGHGPHYISAMKAAGYIMRYATRDTLANVLAWLEAHPDFRTTEYVERSTHGGSAMKRIRIFSGNSRKPWLEFDVSERNYASLVRIAKVRGVTLAHVFCEVMQERLRARGHDLPEVGGRLL
ncbi:MAG TPA: hypothetical protein VGI60_01125 [Chthoniobacterales bacterium]|jgi:hypothetical protein